MEKKQPIENILSTYTLKVKCLNCNYGALGGEIVEIKKGSLVGYHPCPKCDCDTLVKIN